MDTWLVLKIVITATVTTFVVLVGLLFVLAVMLGRWIVKLADDFFAGEP